MKLVVHNGARSWRGNEAMTGTLVRGLAERGHEVVVSCVAGSEVEARMTWLGARTTGVRPQGDLDLLSAWRFSRMLRKEAPDALLLTDTRRMPWAAWAGSRAEVGRVVARLGLPITLPEKGIRRTALLRWVDRWYVPADENAEVLVADAPRLRGTVHVVANGMAIPGPVEPADLRGELGLGERDLIVAGVGAVAPRKGFDLLVRALSVTAADVHLVVAGDTSNARPLRQLVEDLGLEARVHFLEHRSDLPNVLAACDLFVLSSRMEGCPPVLLEAILAGAPAVVATDVAGVPAILGFARRDDGVVGRGGGAPTDLGPPPWIRGPTGWMAEPGNERALVGAVADAIRLRRSDPLAYRRLGAAARKRVREHFTVEAMVEGVEKVLFGPDERPRAQDAPARRRRRER